MLKTEWISCNNSILATLSFDIKQKRNFNIYSILWKCQQGRNPSRIDISPNKSLGTPVIAWHASNSCDALCILINSLGPDLRIKMSLMIYIECITNCWKKYHVISLWFITSKIVVRPMNIRYIWSCPNKKKHFYCVILK